MNVYFARSLRGVNDGHRAIYKTILKAITDAGHTPSLTLPPLPRDPSLTWEQYVHERDLTWIDQSQIMVVEGSSPSHDVGYEVAYGVFEAQIPVGVFALKDTSLAAMFSRCQTFEYRDTPDLAWQLADFLDQWSTFYESQKGIHPVTDPGRSGGPDLAR